jgi:sugar lactone lactonase YvrE
MNSIHIGNLRASKHILILLFVLTAPIQAQNKAPTFPDSINFEGQPEGVVVDPVGNVYVSVRASSDQVWKVSSSGEMTLLADLGEPGGGASGLAIDKAGNVCVCRAMTDPGVYRIAPDGETTRVPGTDQIVFPNALAFDSAGTLYISETFSGDISSGSFGPGGIWRVTKGGTAELWVRDELLTGLPPAFFPFPVGANGIGIHHDDVYVANTDKALLVRISVRPDGSAGQPEVWKKTEDVPESPLCNSASFPVMLDGLALDAQGNVYLAVISRNAVVRINADDRSQETVACHPEVALDAPASLALATNAVEGDSLFVTNLGMFKDFIPDQTWPGPGLIKTTIQQKTGLDWSPVGTWVVSVEMATGTMLMLDNVQAQDSTGSYYGGVSKQVNVNPTHFGLFPEVDSGDEMYMTQTVRTGPNSFQSTHLTYGISTEEDSQAITKLIVMVNTQWQMTGVDTVEGDGTAALYLAEQDADGDGFPDEGETPTVCLPFPFTGKRLHVMSLCEPAVMPEG